LLSVETGPEILDLTYVNGVLKPLARYPTGVGYVKLLKNPYGQALARLAWVRASTAGQ